MNKLGENLAKGDKVVISSGDHSETVEVFGGFGMSADSNGRALYVRRINGLTLDARDWKIRRATEAEAATFDKNHKFEVETLLRSRVEGARKQLQDSRNTLKTFLKTGEVPIGL